MVLSLTHVVHHLTILLRIIHFYGNLADITPVEYTTSWFVSDGMSLILFQILSLALNFSILIYIVQWRGEIMTCSYSSSSGWSMKLVGDLS